MIRVRILFYELKRAFLSKTYLFLLLLIGIYSVYTLRTSVLRGYADTAPFSEWSFMSYLFLVAPFLATVLLFYISKLFSPYEKNVKRFTSSTPLSGPIYFFIKLSAAALTYITAALLVIFICLAFYWKVFDFHNLKIFMVCILLVLIPQFLFLQGIGLWASKMHHNLAFAIIALIFLMRFMSFTPMYFADILGGSILKIPMGKIPVKGIIAFTVPAEYTVSRIIFSVIGILLIITACIKYSSIKDN